MVSESPARPAVYWAPAKVACASPGGRLVTVAVAAGGERACFALVRICIVYDCLFPHTVGGAERWYRNLAERLVAEGHEVAYLTLRQWGERETPDVDPRVAVVVAGPRMALYAGGRRRVLPPLVFGFGVLRHLLRHGGDYDVVHTCSFPYFSLLAAALMRPLWRFGLVVDWFEFWSEDYWRSYLGGLGGRVGALVQRLCARVPQRAFCFSQLHARRLRDAGLAGEPTVLRGLYVGGEAAREAEAGRGNDAYDGDAGPEADEGRDGHDAHSGDDGSRGDDAGPRAPFVLFAGRLIPEKRAPLGVAGVARACERIPALRGLFLGDGPERGRVLAEIAERGMQARIGAPGFVATEEVEGALARALCMLLPSSREGYGMVVVEAAARGTPSIVIAGEDNAAVELVVEGENGTIVPRAEPDQIAAAIERIFAAGPALRERTAAWYRENADQLSLESSLAAVLASYARRGPPAARDHGGAAA
jgi:glycosyltransferase involved in cell wall biosynthesis